MTFFTPLQVRPLDPAFALSNIMTAIANSEGVNVPILPLSILHNFTFHYVPAALSVKGNVSYGSISGMLDMRFAMPAIGSNAIEDKHVFFHEPSAVNRKLGNMSITLQSHPCDSSVDEHATTFDLSNIPAAQLLVATGQYTADNSSIHVPEPMFDPTVLKSADQGASTRFRCSSGAVQSISTTGPLQSNRTSVSLLGNKVTYQ